MMELIITGWKPGLKTVSLMETLRRYKGVGLRQSRQEVDNLLAGQPIHLSGLDSEIAAKARAELEALGCVCG